MPVQEKLKDGKIIIKFGATWCGPCNKPDLLSLFSDLEKEHKNIQFLKVDVDQESELADFFDVSALPCFVILLNGKQVGKNLESSNLVEITEMVKEFEGQ